MIALPRTKIEYIHVFLLGMDTAFDYFSVIFMDSVLKQVISLLIPLCCRCTYTGPLGQITLILKGQAKVTGLLCAFVDHVIRSSGA